MALKGFTQKSKPLEILTDEQIKTIQQGALNILEETGVVMDHQQALELFEGNGAQVDFKTKRVKIPPGLVEDCLRKCPNSFRMKARDSKNDLIMGGNSGHFGTFPGKESVDIETWERRTVSREEYYDGVTVLDALENLHFLSAYCPYYGYEGVPPVMGIPESVAAKLRNSTKCVLTGSNEDSEIFTIKMATLLNTEIMGGCSCASPLTYNEGAIESTYRFVNSDNPIQVISGPLMGATAPATIAGSMVMNTAEMMAGITLIQLIKPGTRVMVTNFVMQEDMTTGMPAFGAIGNFLYQATFNQLWRKYQIPTKTSATGPSSSKKIDFQLGYEKSLGAMIAALSGTNLIYLHGGIYGELTFHPLQAILDDDVAGMIGRFLKGVEVTNETLAIDLIKKIGPIPGFYLDTEHTLNWWRHEQFLPKAADRKTYPSWIERGKKDCIDYAKKRMAHILSTHKISIPLTEDQDRGINNILEEAHAYYKSKGKI